jgi:hypothetical protein
MALRFGHGVEAAPVGLGGLVVLEDMVSRGFGIVSFKLIAVHNTADYP